MSLDEHRASALDDLVLSG